MTTALKINGNTVFPECQLNLQRSVLRDPQNNKIHKMIVDETDLHGILTLRWLALVTPSLCVEQIWLY